MHVANTLCTSVTFVPDFQGTSTCIHVAVCFNIRICVMLCHIVLDVMIDIL
jgi:hypothetical protein